MKKKNQVYLIVLLVFVSALTFKSEIQEAQEVQGIFQEKTVKMNGLGPSYSNATLISDGYAGIYWNDGGSYSPSIAVDGNGIIHAVWYDNTNGVWGMDAEIFYARYSSNLGWSYPIVISDGFMGSYWNDEDSFDPSLAVSEIGEVHVVWEDITDGIWGTDWEIMHVKYTPNEGWSNITVISDGYAGIYWNDGVSTDPSIAVSEIGEVHVVWEDTTDGIWGSDTEIMHVKYTSDEGWSNITVISDGYAGIYWNDLGSYDTSIAVDGNGIIHAVWYDNTNGVWGSDIEIMHVKYTSDEGWSNITVISDGYAGIYWNDGVSTDPSIAVSEIGEVHVVWEDTTDGIWGSDTEIMHVKYTSDEGWSNITVISDGYAGIYWNDGDSTNPQVSVSNQGNIHVVWSDLTAGSWGGGSEHEIMFSTFEPGYNWIFPIVISDGYSGMYWNNGASLSPAVAVTDNGVVHVTWHDLTTGIWGTDAEIMYATVEFYYPSEETPGDFSLSTDAMNPDSDGNIILTWSKAQYATEYAIMMEINGSIIEYAVGLQERTFIITNLQNGSYSFHIIASNVIGDSISNKIIVTVNISIEDDNGFDNDEDPSAFMEFLQDYGILSGLGVVAILVLIMGLKKK